MNFTQWAARIIGTILILVSVFSLIGYVADPVAVRGAMAVGSITSILWIAFGAFLIAMSLRKFPTEEEESARLSRNRNWIFALILLTSILSSAEAWLMNDYFAGMTALNVMMIYDVLFNIGLVYLVLQLLSNPNRLPKGFFAYVGVYSLGLAAIYVWRGFPFLAASMLVFIVYFGYSTLAPLTRRNFRIAHLVLLPTMLVAMIGASALEERSITKLVERESAIDQQYDADLDILGSSYGIYLEKSVPTKDDIRDVQEAIDRWTATADKNIVVIKELEQENLRQLPSTGKEANLEYWRRIVGLIELRKEQLIKIDELMEYAKTVNFNALSDAQSDRMNVLEEEVLAIGDRITSAEVEMSQNLNL